MEVIFPEIPGGNFGIRLKHITVSDMDYEDPELSIKVDHCELYLVSGQENMIDSL